MRRRGFTLLELLVVISIIAILAALLMPVFMQARESARKSTCLSNLRQLGMAVAAYSADWDEMLPATWDGAVGAHGNSGTGGWMMWTNFYGPARFYPEQGALAPYVKNSGIFECPSAPARLGCSYAINSALSTGTPLPAYYSGLPLAALSSPSSTFLLVEEGSDGTNNHPNTTDDAYFNVQMNVLARRHHGAPNFLYCDGHVKALKLENVYYPNPQGAHRFEP